MTLYRRIAAKLGIPFLDVWWSSDACPRCDGRGEIPKVPGDHRIMARCGKCHGTGRRGG